MFSRSKLKFRSKDLTVLVLLKVVGLLEKKCLCECLSAIVNIRITH